MAVCIGNIGGGGESQENSGKASLRRRHFIKTQTGVKQRATWMLGEEHSSRGNSKGKGPEAGPCLAWLRTCKEARVAAAVEGQGGEWEETGQAGGQAVPRPHGHYWTPASTEGDGAFGMESQILTSVVRGRGPEQNGKIWNFPSQIFDKK